MEHRLFEQTKSSGGFIQTGRIRLTLCQWALSGKGLTSSSQILTLLPALNLSEGCCGWLCRSPQPVTVTDKPGLRGCWRFRGQGPLGAQLRDRRTGATDKGAYKALEGETGAYLEDARNRSGKW